MSSEGTFTVLQERGKFELIISPDYMELENGKWAIQLLNFSCSPIAKAENNGIAVVYCNAIKGMYKSKGNTLAQSSPLGVINIPPVTTNYSNNFPFIWYTFNAIRGNSMKFHFKDLEGNKFDLSEYECVLHFAIKRI